MRTVTDLANACTLNPMYTRYLDKMLQLNKSSDLMPPNFRLIIFHELFYKYNF